MTGRKKGPKAPSSAGAVIKRRQPAKASKRATAKRKPNELVGKLKPKQTPQEANASELVAGLGPNAAAAWAWSAFPFGETEKTVDLTTTLTSIIEASERVNAGDLGDVEALLTAQTVTLNAVFVTLAYRANKTRQMDHFERYLRLALKAQSQCRTTCEALAELKRPPVFTRQANIAAQQVVNNGTLIGGSRARDSQTAQNEVMEGHGERLDCEEAAAASRRHPRVATVGALDRAPNTGRQGAVVTKRLSRR